MRFFKIFVPLLLAGLVAVSGCEDLSVQNQNDPDRERALSSPGDVETLIQGTFRSYYLAGESYEPNFALSVAADEQSSSYGNFGMQDAGTEPRAPFNNDPSYTYSAVTEIPFSNSYSAISSALDGISAIEDEGVVIEDEAQTQRAKAFAEMVVGLAHANIAVTFDQGFVVHSVPEVGLFDPDDAPFEIVSAQVVWEDGALPFLERAIQTAENSSFSSIPSGWMGNMEFSREEFISIIKMYRAHYRVAMARTPQEREEVDWQQVENDIDEGYTELTGETFMMVDSPQENWFSGFRYYGKSATWTRADYKTIGPADESGNYEEWLDDGLSERTPFDVTTDDRRITGEGDAETPQEEADGKYFYYSGQPPFPSDRGIYFYGYYTYWRNIATLDEVDEGNEKWIVTPNTMKILKAEALLHQDPVANAPEIVSLINESRVGVGELDPAQVTDPAGSMSDAQNPQRDDGATLWSMMKHEKRMESFNTINGLAFFDRRGWGDLVEGTFEDLPIPGAELQLLEEAIYTSDIVGDGNSKTHETD